SVLPDGTPVPVTFVVSSSGPPLYEVATPAGTFRNDTVLSAPLFVLNCSVASPSDGVVTFTVPLKTTSVLLAMLVVSNAPGGVEALANWIVVNPPTAGPFTALNEPSGVARS